MIHYIRAWVCLSALCLCVLAVDSIQAATSISILPGKFTLSGAAAHQQLLVEQFKGDQFVGQLTNNVSISSSDTNVLKIENGVALPLKNGTVTIQARAGKQTARSEVTIENMDKPFEWSFRNHVQPVLAKAGCSAGACHGAAAGQNGFKLSLRGYDNEGDYLTLTRRALGRRIVPSDPGRSLMLLKPTGAVPHKGGKRFEIDSIDYKILSEWIASGTPGPKENEVRIERIEILPEHYITKPGASQQLNVLAHFTDGHTEDVTHWVKYTSANGTVAQVDDNGEVRTIGFGEGAITGWYLSRIAIATATAPYTNKVTKSVFTKTRKRNFIDEQVMEKLQSLNLPPSPKSNDSEFIRRAFVDTIGVLPTAQETRTFLSNKDSKKRDNLIESLLNRPEFVDYWTYKWSDLLLVETKKLKPAAMWSYYNWIRNNVAANTPWDKFVRDLITSEGSTLENGAANFYVLHDDPRAMAETCSQAFLGMSIQCAKCHNHPMEKWTNDQYYKMANLFARVRTKNGARDGDNIVFVANTGDLVQPLTGKPQAPTPLDGTAMSLESVADRRAHLADWLISRDNPYFSRAIVNRIWKNFFGAGLVENVDDLRVTNPASNEKLFSAAAEYLADQKFDLKALMRVILQSEAYQHTSTALPENTDDSRFYSHYFPRRVMAEVLLDTLSEATGTPSEFKDYPKGWRAMQLPDSNIDSYFLKSFGRPEREKTCECERTAEPNVTQVLHIANGDTINKKLEAKDNLIAKWIAAKMPPEKIVEEAYLTALARFPTATEKEKIKKVLDAAGEKDQRAALEDLYWALLSSKEFLFNH
jgi:formylmethanofuran dehydrogenase subunit D